MLKIIIMIFNAINKQWLLYRCDPYHNYINDNYYTQAHFKPLIVQITFKFIFNAILMMVILILLVIVVVASSMFHIQIAVTSCG